MLDVPAQTDALLDRLQRAAFGYFLEHFNPANGLVADTSRPGSPVSIAVVGFALSCYPVGVERGWMTREEAARRTLAALRFFSTSEHGKGHGATGYKGFYYHFLDIHTGKRVWNCELSLIDSALLFAGMLTAGAYFDQANAEEAELRALVDALYGRADWLWARNGQATVCMGWKPKSGFLPYYWDGYSEATILYILGLGSPSYALPPESFAAWTATYEWQTVLGRAFLYAGPLFIHQFSHAWIDFRGIQDRYMREKSSDYFQNSRQAVYVQRDYAIQNPRGFAGYDEDCWGFSAGEGPTRGTRTIVGRKRKFFGYEARGAPYGPDDGTISPWGPLAALPFAPEIALPALGAVRQTYPEVVVGDRFSTGFNPSLPGAGAAGWVSEGFYGLDQGLVVMTIENVRSGLIWRLMRECRAIRAGLARAGFTGGWL